MKGRWIDCQVQKKVYKMQKLNQNIALLLIDVQKGFDDIAYWGGGRNNPNAETICGDILAKFRELSLPIFHIRHALTTPQSRLHPTHDGFAFHDNVLPKDGEPVITKNVNSGFIGTDLHEQLQNKGINRQIFDAELIHQTALASLNNEFASVINSKHLFESFK